MKEVFKLLLFLSWLLLETTGSFPCCTATELIHVPLPHRGHPPEMDIPVIRSTPPPSALKTSVSRSLPERQADGGIRTSLASGAPRRCVEWEGVDAVSLL